MATITFYNGPKYRRALRVIKNLCKDKNTKLSTNGYPTQHEVIKALKSFQLDDIAQDFKTMSYYELEDFFVNNIDQ